MDDRRHFILSLDIDDVCRFDDLIVRDNRILIESIENDLTSFSEEKGISPVVCLDYLQIVNTENPLYKSDKQDMDLKTLRLLSIKDYTKNALLAVSSFNRESYRVDKIKSTSLFDFKESGSIEYSSIVVLSIFPISREFTDYPLYKEKNFMVWRMLKNRYSKRKDGLFSFLGRVNHFEEDPHDMNIEFLENIF